MAQRGTLSHKRRTRPSLILLAGTEFGTNASRVNPVEFGDRSPTGYGIPGHEFLAPRRLRESDCAHLYFSVCLNFGKPLMHLVTDARFFVPER